MVLIEKVFSLETDIYGNFFILFNENRSYPEVFVNIYGFDKMCCKYMYILGERMVVNSYIKC